MFVAAAIFIRPPWMPETPVWQEIDLYGKIMVDTKDEAEVNHLRNIPEQDKPLSGGRAASIITTFMLFLCIIAVAIYSYYRSTGMTAGLPDIFRPQAGSAEEVKEAEVQHTFGFDMRDKPVFTIFRGNIVKCSRSGILFLDSTGQIVRSESIEFDKPIVKTNGSRILVADSGSTGIYVMDGNTVIWQDRTDAAILNADISDDGYVTVITSAKRDNNTVRVYESHGLELFRKIIANDYAVSACVSPSRQYLVLSAIGTGAVGPFSRYKFYDMEGKELSGLSFGESGELLPLFWFNKNDSIFAVGDNAVASIEPSGKTEWREQFRSIAGAGLAGEGLLAVAAETDEGALLNVYMADGARKASVKLNGRPAGLDSIKGIISVYTDDAVYFFDVNGTIISKYITGEKVLQVCLFDKKQAAVITEGEVTVVGIN